MTGRKDNVFRNENDFNNLKAACEECNGPNCTRSQVEIAKTLSLTQSQFSRYAKEHKNNNFPASYADAQAQGRGVGGSGSCGTIPSSELRRFATENQDVDDNGWGSQSELHRTFTDQFPGIDCLTRRSAMRTVRAIIKRLCKERAARAALAAEAPEDDDSSDDSSDDEPFR